MPKIKKQKFAKLKTVIQLKRQIAHDTKLIDRARKERVLDTTVLEQMRHQKKVLLGAMLQIYPGGVRPIYQ